jgi:1-hydroxycarotenoid 3,4-desaturase
MPRDRIIIIGAGMGGLAAALALASRGEEVLLLERAAAPGGKMRRLDVGGHMIDGGPTVLTMRWVFEELFAAAGAALSEHVTLEPLSVLARHGWSAAERLDLHADLKDSADAIGRFAGAEEARRFLAFSAEARRIYETLEKPFIRAQRPNPFTLATANGLQRAGADGADQPVRDHVEGAGAALPRPAPAAAVRALCDLLRLISLPCTRDADAGGACGAGRRVDGEGRHA